MKKNLILIIATIVLGAAAIFTGVKIYQLREEPVAPTQPKGVTEQCRLVLDIPAPTSTPTATPTPTPTLTPTPTPTPIPECWQICVNDDNCPQDLACQAVNKEKRCVNPECPEEKNCQCPAPTATPTPTPTPTPTLTPTPTPTPTLTSIPPTATPQPTTAPQATATPQPTTVYVQRPTSVPLAQAPTATPTPPTELPEAGSLWPTIGVTIGGIILGIIGLLLAF